MFLRFHAAYAAILLASATFGCASMPQANGNARAAAPNHRLAFEDTPSSPTLAAAVSTSAPLDIESVQALARRENPNFEVFAANLEIARAEAIQAALYPNPEAEGSLGNARSREIAGENEIEYGLSVTQPIELPSKRRTRRAAAEAAIPIAEREAEVFGATLRAEVAKAFWTIAFHERAVRLAEENARIASDIETVVKRRVEGGESPEIDQIKSKVESLKTSRAVQAQKRRLAAARSVLSALCGGVLPSGYSITGELAGEEAALDLETSIQSKGTHPRIRKLEAEIERQNAVIAREKASWHPDLRPGVFGEREADADTFGVTLGIELPIFNRNQGGIAGAKAELKRLEAETRSVQLEVLRQIEEAWQAHESAMEQISAFGAGLREGAAEALKIETFLYEQGETGFLQLLDARRTAQETEAEYLQAIFDARISRAELEQAMGIGGMEP